MAHQKRQHFCLQQTVGFLKIKALFLEKLGGIEPRPLLAGFASQIALLCIHFIHA